MVKGLKILIVGAGIGGLALARVLALRGADVTVLEQAPEIAEVGAGLQISPNGLAVLRALGLAGALEASGAVLADTVQLKDYRGAGVLKLDLTQLSPQKYYFVHRADLIELLAEGARAAGVKIQLLQKVESVEDGPLARIILASGEVREADLIVGCDGVHSVVRGALNGAEKPFFTGNAAWRATVPNLWGRRSDVQVHMGPRRHLVSYPLKGGAMVNLVAVEEQRKWLAESWMQEDDPANLQAAFDDFGAEAKAMLAEVREVKQWGLFRHPVAVRWHGESLALLGDAAHPTLPFLAQGAVMALEDAWAMGVALDRAERLSQGLETYQLWRRARAEKVINTATGNAWKYHLSFGPLRFAAHSVLRLGGAVAPMQMLKQFDWLYGYDVTTDLPVQNQR
ncbi:FAD-dependent oxidoreductase [Lentibacter sp. XHP0401]|uniref:FAD-dependent oxidoreductase n=1 Tax=Lentibacter sp. XHP0401 TaxID=2984334 RepID=UPI0021E714C0|nr:FAD-dependent oxidoreductase [Lentibacter sp. XHP0401]MCV2891687.1 FAD-dependent monooxygenase [Lentibacter sp. XHP0401]